MEGVAAEEEGEQVVWGVTSRRLVQIALVSVCVFVCVPVCEYVCMRMSTRMIMIMIVSE